MEFGDFQLVEEAGVALEVVGALLIAFGFAFAATRALLNRIRGSDTTSLKTLRSEMTTALLLGLEVLVAADIVKTVALDASLRAVASLGLLVLIRTFLTWTILMEEEGRWPWEPDTRAGAEPTATAPSAPRRQGR